MGEDYHSLYRWGNRDLARLRHAAVSAWLARLRFGPRKADAKAWRLGHPSRSQSIGPRLFWHEGPVPWKTIFLQTRVGEMVSGWFEHTMFISSVITSSPPQVSRHWIQEAADPCLRGGAWSAQESCCLGLRAPSATLSSWDLGAGAYTSLSWLFLFVKQS